MPSFKLFSALACLLCLASPALTQPKPKDNRTLSTDSRSFDLPSFKPPTVIGGKNLDEWAGDLKARDPSVRKRALIAIIQFGDQSGKYVPDVLKVMHDHDASPKMKAIVATRMMYIPETQKTLVFKELGRCLIDTYSEGVHRYEAVNSLIYLMNYRFGPLTGDERKIILDLVRVCSSHNSELREICIDALITAGPDPDKGPETAVTDALINMANPFREPAEAVRYKAIMALGALGRPQDPHKFTQVVNVLRNRGNYYSRNRIIKMWTHVSLMALDEKVPQQEVDAIVSLLGDPESHIKIQAITALGALRKKGQAYVGKICSVASRELIKRGNNQKDQMVLMVVAQALAGMGTKGKHVLDTLIKITELDERESVSAVLAACQALRELGANDAATMEALDKVAKHSSLDQYEKRMVGQLIEDMKNPRKPLKGVR